VEFFNLPAFYRLRKIKFMKQSLGRGLESLIPRRKEKTSSFSKKENQLIKEESFSSAKKESVFNIEIDKIKSNPRQPRQNISEESLKELAASIREHGILQPLIVSKIEKPTERGQDVEYEIIAGERRWRAAKMAGLPRVPVIIRESTPRAKLEAALVENLQRENLNPIELALGFKQLYEEFGLTHQEIGEKVGKQRTTVSNIFRLLDLPQEIQNALINGQIAEGHARAILMARPTARMRLFREVVKKQLSVRQTELKAQRLARPDNVGGRGPKNPYFKKRERELVEIIGRPVSITQRGKIGSLKIEFIGRKELDKLTDHLLKLK